MGRRHKSDVASYIVPDTDPSRRTRGSGASPPEWPPRGAFHGPAAAAYGRPRHPRLTASERHRCPPQCAAHPSAAAYDCESQPAPASTRKRCPRPTAHVDERHDAHHAVDAGEHQPHPTAHDGEHHAASGHAGQRRPCPAAPACKLQSRPTAHAGEHHPASGDAGERHPWAATSACKRQPPPTAHAGEHHPAPGDAGKCRASRIDYSSTCHGCPDASPDAMGRCPCVSLPEGWFVHRPCGFFSAHREDHFVSLRTSDVHYQTTDATRAPPFHGLHSPPLHALGMPPYLEAASWCRRWCDPRPSHSSTSFGRNICPEARALASRPPSTTRRCNAAA
mmetsp:Transcript_33608/g.76053  ORF Transcript_33608/g.76053 Transcript_33608/m.76053 type:complete len:335 (-) Transcript_33608:135-1139(-)